MGYSTIQYSIRRYTVNLVYGLDGLLLIMVLPHYAISRVAVTRVTLVGHDAASGTSVNIVNVSRVRSVSEAFLAAR